MVDKKFIMTLEDIYNQFPTKNDCINYLEKLRWGDNPVCPYCNSNNFTELKEEHRYHCNTCNISYSVTVDTMFHKTKIDLQKWFFLIYLMLETNMNLSLRELGNVLGVTKDTAMRMSNKIKNSLLKQDDLIYKIKIHER